MRRLYYCDCYAIPLPEGHKFPLEKYRLAREMLERSGLYQIVRAPLADAGTIQLAHESDYVRRFLQGRLEPQEIRRIGFPWSEALVKRTLASVGGTLSAVEDALEWGLGGNLAGGTHHAFYSEGSGFCVFNDIAVAIHAARHRGRVQRVAVVDLDVHQGDGTAKFFEHDSAVFTFSMHGRNNFPFRKQTSKVDIELPDGTADASYLALLEAHLPRVVQFRPELVIYQSGVDPLYSDRLGKLQLTHDGLMARDEMVLAACHRAGIPVAITLGGGYAEPVEETARAHANTFRVAAAIAGRTAAATAP